MNYQTFKSWNKSNMVKRSHECDAVTGNSIVILSREPVQEAEGVGRRRADWRGVAVRSRRSEVQGVAYLVTPGSRRAP